MRKDRLHWAWMRKANIPCCSVHLARRTDSKHIRTQGNPDERKAVREVNMKKEYDFSKEEGSLDPLQKA
jgi:hypothetical protein